MSSMDDIGSEFVKSLFNLLKANVTPYCGAAIDAAYEYCIQEFKKACADAGIAWNESWEGILYD